MNMNKEEVKIDNLKNLIVDLRLKSKITHKAFNLLIEEIYK